jgi:amino acid transporter
LVPGLEESKAFYFAVMLTVFWGSTFLNFYGIQTSGWISTLGVLAGTVIPGILIIALGVWWFLAGHNTHISFSLEALIPQFELENMVLFSGILLSLVGVEVAAYHIREAKHPQKDFPKALLIASILILLISIFGTLAIAIVVPQGDISLLSGLIQAFTVFFNAFDMLWVVPVLALLALIGSLAGINTWIVGPAKGLLVAAEDKFLPPFLMRVNDKGVPTGMLLFQAMIGTILSFVFLWMDSHSAAYWILTAISAQFAIVQYGFVFAAALRLRYSQPNVARAYRVPFGNWGIWLITVIGLMTCLFGFWIVFVPPAQLDTGNSFVNQTMLGVTFIVLSLLPIALSGKSRRLV